MVWDVAIVTKHGDYESRLSPYARPLKSWFGSKVILLYSNSPTNVLDITGAISQASIGASINLTKNGSFTQVAYVSWFVHIKPEPGTPGNDRSKSKTMRASISRSSK